MVYLQKLSSSLRTWRPKTSGTNRIYHCMSGTNFLFITNFVPSLQSTPSYLNVPKSMKSQDCPWKTLICVKVAKNKSKCWIMKNSWYDLLSTCIFATSIIFCLKQVYLLQSVDYNLGQILWNFHDHCLIEPLLHIKNCRNKNY